MTDFLQLLIVGIESGMIYALMGLALTAIFRTARVFNFAQGTMAACGGFVAYSLITDRGFPWLIAAVVALVVLALGASVFERLIVRPVLRRDLFSVILATLAVDLILTNVLGHIYGFDANPFPFPIDNGSFKFAGLRVTYWSLVILTATLVLLLVLNFIVQHTEVGLAMRAFVQDQDATALMGVPVATVSRASWVLATVVGGVVGILVAPVLFLQVGYMSRVFLKGFVAAALGGFVSFPGTVVGGVFLGIVESLTVKYAPSQFVSLLPAVVVFAGLMIRPAGLFSRVRRFTRV